jgi:hypothetical protein
MPPFTVLIARVPGELRRNDRATNTVRLSAVPPSDACVGELLALLDRHPSVLRLILVGNGVSAASLWRVFGESGASAAEPQ